jgi:hypothetical protein
LAVIGSIATITAAGTKFGLDVGGVVSKNMNIEEAIKNSPPPLSPLPMAGREGGSTN